MVRLVSVSDELDDRETRLAVDPTQIPVEPARYGNGEKLGNLVGVEFLKRLLQPVNGAGPRFEHHNDLGFVGQLVFPTVERSRAGKDRPAGDQASIEQGSHELGGFVSGGEGGKNDDGVSMTQATIPEEVNRI